MTAPTNPHPAPPSAYRESGPEDAVRRGHVFTLALILLVGCFLRFLWIDSTAVWCDELLSIHISNAHNFAVDGLPRDTLLTDVPDLMTIDNARPWWQVWGAMGGDMHPPFYYLSLRIWRECFGDSPTAIRSLSAILGTLAVLAIFFAGRELCGTAGGLWVAAINALAAYHVYYSQEARMYALVLLWVSLAMFLVLRIERLGFTLRRGAALSAVSLLAMLTLYMSAAVLIPCGLYALIRFRGRTRTMTLFAFLAAGILWSIVWLPFILGQHFHALKSDWLKASREGLLTVTLERLALLPMRQLGGVIRRSMEPAAYVFAAVYLLPAIAVRRRPAILLPWLAMLFVVGIPAVTDLYRSTNMLHWTRYTVTLIPAMSLAIVATALVLFHGKSIAVRYALPAGLTLFTTLSLIPLYTEMPRYDFRAYALAAERMKEKPGGRLIFASTWNYKFNSVLMLAMQYYWKTPPRELIFVESVEAVAALPRDWITDQLILCAGDNPADLSKLPDFESAGDSTWELGVGAVNALRRRPATGPDAPPAIREKP